MSELVQILAATASPVPWYGWVILGIGIPLAAASIVMLLVVIDRAERER